MSTLSLIVYATINNLIILQHLGIIAWSNHNPEQSNKCCCCVEQELSKFGYFCIFELLVCQRKYRYIQEIDKNKLFDNLECSRTEV